MNRMGFLCILLSCLGAWLLPLVFPGPFEASLAKLGIPQDLAVIYFLAMLAGSAVNIPIWSFAVPRFVCADPLAVLGLDGLLPHWTELRRRTVIAMNLGGFVVPGAIALYEVSRLATSETPYRSILALALAACVNCGVALRLSHHVQCVGFAVPGLVTPWVAAASALLFKSSEAPPIAFVAGWFGPVACSILRLRALRSRSVAVASIGGAGTFDAILLNAVLSTVLSPGACPS